MKLELWYPVKPLKVNQPFGVNGEWYQKNGVNIKGHNGIDFMAIHGEPVYASHNGTAYPETDMNQGHGVVLFSDDLYDYGDKGLTCKFKTIYWHFLPMQVVQSGQKIKVGDLLGYADSTGLSTGDHLHFGLKPVGNAEPANTWMNLEQSNGYGGAIDPAPYFNGQYAKDVRDTIQKLQDTVTALKKLLGLK